MSITDVFSIVLILLLIACDYFKRLEFILMASLGYAHLT